MAIEGDLIYGDFDGNNSPPETGNDTLWGYSNNDTIFGWGGDDWLNGGGDFDVLNGGDDDFLTGQAYRRQIAAEHLPMSPPSTDTNAPKSVPA